MFDINGFKYFKVRRHSYVFTALNYCRNNPKYYALEVLLKQVNIWVQNGKNIGEMISFFTARINKAPKNLLSKKLHFFQRQKNFL